MSTPSTGHASLIGQTFAGYHVLGLIGRGAMGAVYLAEDIQLQRRVALKVLLGALARNPAMVKSFQMEARAAAPLRHTNIVRVYNAGIQDGTPFMAMEYVEGEPLDRFLRRKGHMPWQGALYIGQQVAEALDCAHSHGLVHRDVKPGNILLDAEGRARLADFGIANIHTDDDAGPQAAFVGTPHYMSPEQCSGKKVTPSSDLFSLGVMLYRMISGKLPFQSDDPMELIRKITYEDPPRLNKITVGVPDDVARLVAHLMQKDPAKRPRDASTAASMVKKLQAEQGGRSALPAALSAFVRDEAEIRTVANVPSSSKRRSSTHSKKKSGEGSVIGEFFESYGRAVAIMLLAIICAVAGGQIALAIRPAPEPVIAPVIGAIAATAPATRAGTFASDAYRVRDFVYLSNQQIAATVEGAPGSLSVGARGLVRFDLDTETIYSLRAPAAPTLDVEFSNALPVPAAYSRSGNVSTSYAPVALAHHGSAEVALHRHFIDTTASDPERLMTLATSTSQPIRVLAIAESPNRSVALLSEGKMHRIVQWTGADRKPTTLIESEEPIAPESVQLDSSGNQIVYAQHTTPSRAKLYFATVGPQRATPVLLTIGDLSPYTAFSPDNAAIAFSQRDPIGGYTTHTIGLKTLKASPPIGAGQLVEQGWSNAVNRLIVTARPNPGDTPQLMSIDPAQAGPPLLLTRIPKGISTPALVSPNGSHAIAMIAGDRPHVILIDLRATHATGNLAGGQSST